MQDTRLDRFPRFGAGSELDSMRELMRRLGDPQKTLCYIHVAGTNGKGSTTTMCASILQKAGKRTGLYTSPYIRKFNERMQIDGTPIDDAALSALLDRVCPVAEQCVQDGYALAQFSVVTALAFCWFAEQRCDVVCLEVGLGGRMDATNCIEQSLVSVIAPIGLDHCAVLGDTVEQIAWEKCGIIKPGGLVVVSPQQPDEALAVCFAACAQQNAKLMLPSTATLQDETIDPLQPQFSFDGERYTLSLIGPHQLQNAVTALEVVRALRQRGWWIPQQAVIDGLRDATLPARLQLLSREPLVLLDGAHNPHGTEALAAFLDRLQRPITLVMGMLADKDVAQAIEPLCKRATCAVAVPVQNPRAMSPDALRRLLAAHTPQTAAFDSLAEGIAYAKRQAGETGAVVICGSLYLAGEVLALDL